MQSLQMTTYFRNLSSEIFSRALITAILVKTDCNENKIQFKKKGTIAIDVNIVYVCCSNKHSQIENPFYIRPFENISKHKKYVLNFIDLFVLGWSEAVGAGASPEKNK